MNKAKEEDVKDESKDTDKPKSSSGKKTLSLGGTLSLKAGGTSGGSSPAPSSRTGSGAAVVEVKRRRSTTQKADQTESDDTANLTEEEKEARVRALKQAEEYAKTKPKEEKKYFDRAAAQEAEAAEKKRQNTEEEARRKEIEEMQRIEDVEKKKRDDEAAKRKLEAERMKPIPSGRTSSDDDNEMSYRDRIKKQAAKRKPTSDRGRRSGKLTVTQVLNKDYERDRGPSLAAQRRAREKARMAADSSNEPLQKQSREVVVPETITVQELSNRMAEAGGEVVKSLMKMGVMATINQVIDADTAELIVDEFGHKIKRVSESDVEDSLDMLLEDEDEKNLESRPPVVTIMGHVDHGKTSLLDSLREANVVSGEAGGITQHIGAYQVTMESGEKITFLDTPGHAAFTQMRARGANITDIVVIVVAANDSIMPQTVEAINHAKAAGVPLIIAVNKIDLPDANVTKVKNDLLQHEVVVEEMGGDILCIEVSALKKMNLDKLEEAILLQAEVLELKTNPDRAAVGTVVEAKLEQGRGNVGTVLIQRGTLKIGDIFVIGSEWGKVRAMFNDQGKAVKHAIPGQPVEVLGLNGAPEAGDQLIVVKEEAKAREISEYRQRKKREASSFMLGSPGASFEQLLAASKEADEKQWLNVVIKADVHGSVEAIIGSLNKIEDENEEIGIRVLHSGVGGITESDVILANASNAMIVGFNVRANAQARELAEREGADIRYYNVIYNVIDDAKAILSGLLAPTEREEYLGQAEIRQVFRVTKVGNVAGCMVTRGMVKRGSRVRLLRDDVVVHEGTLKTLKRFKDEAKEVNEGMECGMAFEGYDDIKDGDIIECYDVIEEARVVE